MSPHRRATAAAACLLLAAVALSGCSNPDAPLATRSVGAATTAAAPGSPGEPAAPASPTAGSQAPSQPRTTPQAALSAYAQSYINWSYQTLSSQQLKLAAMSVGAARLSERQAAAASARDSTIARGRVFNSGQVVSVATDATDEGRWVVVTLERTGGSAQYEGLPRAYHVTLARLAAVPGGWAVSEWLPQS
jgi:hypothetical protein